MVAADLEISTSTVRKWLEEASAPSAAHFVRLWYVYGIEFIVSVSPNIPGAAALSELGQIETAKRQIADAEALLASIGERGR